MATIPALGSISAAFEASGLSGLAALSPTTASAPSAGGEGFGDVLLQALDGLSAAGAEVDQLALQAATGDLTAVHDYTVAATEAQLLTQLTTEVRNRAVEAFNDIMHMQV